MSSGISVPVFSNIVNILDFQKCRGLQKYSCPKYQGCFLILFGYPGVSKDKKVGLGGLDMSKNLEIIEMKVFGLSHKQIEKLLYQIEAE